MCILDDAGGAPFNAPDMPTLPADEFTLADRDFALRVSAEFRADKKEASAVAWSQLAAKIEKILVGEWVQVTRLDAHLVQTLHLAVLRYPLASGAKEKSRQLSRFGVLVVTAERGQLAQLNGARNG